MDNHFFVTTKYGDLKIEKIFFETNHPILFTCTNQHDELFICLCAKEDEAGRKWLVNKTKSYKVLQMLQNAVPVRELFQNNGTFPAVIEETDHNIEIKYDDPAAEGLLPKENEYLEPDPGEFDEEIQYYYVKSQLKNERPFTTTKHYQAEQTHLAPNKQKVVYHTEISSSSGLDPFLYHITSKEQLSRILKEGITPKTGTNSLMAEEKEDNVYLCDKGSIPYWLTLLELDDPVILKIPKEDVPGFTDYEHSFGEKYKEYKITKVVSTKNATICSINELCKECKDSLRHILKDHVNTISDTIAYCVRYYDVLASKEGKGNLSLSYQEFSLREQLSKLTKVLGRVTFDVLSKEEIQKSLKSHKFAITRFYNDTDKRLWEMLTEYPKDDLFPLREQLKKQIEALFSDALYTDTGRYYSPGAKKEEKSDKEPDEQGHEYTF